MSGELCGGDHLEAMVIRAAERGRRQLIGSVMFDPLKWSQVETGFRDEKVVRQKHASYRLSRNVAAGMAKEVL